MKYRVMVLFTVYLRTVSSYHLSTLLNWLKLALGRATCTVHSTADQISQKGIECTKTK